MGFDFGSRFEDFQKIYTELLEASDEALGFKISDYMKNGPEQDLKRTEVTQPALLICSTAMARWLDAQNVKAEMALGHSLGEYSALVSSDSIRFEDALKLVHLRGQFMDQALPKGEGGMLALMGASRKDAEAICEEVLKSLGDEKFILSPSVFNTSGQVVVSGHIKAIEEAQKIAENHGVRRAIQLGVSGPFHCALLEPAGEKLRAVLDDVEIRRPSVRVVSNVTASTCFDPAEIKENLVKQVSKPVLWADSVRYAVDEGITDFIEVGSGRVLTGLIRKILPDVKCLALDSLERIELLVA